MKIGHQTGAQGIKSGRPTILFVHGAGGSAASWLGVLSAIGREFNTLAVDLPGHGETPGPAKEAVSETAGWLAEAISMLGKEYGFEKPILAGHSMGGAIGQTLALTRPELLAGLILIGTGSKLPVNEAILQGLLDDFEQTTATVMKWCFAKKNRSVAADSLALLREAGQETLYRDFKACSIFDVRNEIGKIDLPTLVLTGEEDKMTPIAFARELADKIPGADLALVPEAGHMVMIEEPRAVIKAIVGFVKGF